MTTNDRTAADIDYTSSRSVLVVCDDANSRARAVAALPAGCRLAAVVDVSDAVARLDRQALTGGVLVEVAHEPGDPAAFDRLLMRLDREAAAGRYGSVVSTPPAMIDAVAALAGHVRVHQLAGATDAERTAAIALASMPEAMSFRDSAGGDEDSARLRRLTDEVGRIAGALAKLSAGSSTRAQPPRADHMGAPGEPIDAEEIRGIIRARRLRAHYFDPELFADPAWDMLLDLMAAHVDQQRAAVSSLCIAAAVPATTALRWIKTLTDVGLFVRRADPTDGRRVFIELAEGAAAGMRSYLGAVKRLADAPGMGLARMAV